MSPIGRRLEVRDSLRDGLLTPHPFSGDRLRSVWRWQGPPTGLPAKGTSTARTGMVSQRKYSSDECGRGQSEHGSLGRANDARAGTPARGPCLHDRTPKAAKPEMGRRR